MLVSTVIPAVNEAVATNATLWVYALPLYKVIGEKIDKEMLRGYVTAIGSRFEEGVGGSGTPQRL